MALFITRNYSSISKCIRLLLKYYTDISFDFFYLLYKKQLPMFSDLKNNVIDVCIK